MAASGSVCTVGDDVPEAFKAFRKKNAPSGALILKVDKETLQIHVDQTIDAISLSDLAYDLPDMSPRYILYSYKWDRPGPGGTSRVSYPLILIYYCPRDGEPYLSMMYSSSKIVLTSTIDVNKIFDCQDSEELTEEWLIKNLEKGTVRVN
eukprot:c8673_g1_i1.p2 GENE.c8673_g1_i1~~c8673_g1_i1.p2  ORF type:complete len:160 (+),score=39.46 c8673_g1_i1:31-480(+)